MSDDVDYLGFNRLIARPSMFLRLPNVAAGSPPHVRRGGCELYHDFTDNDFKYNYCHVFIHRFIAHDYNVNCDYFVQLLLCFQPRLPLHLHLELLVVRSSAKYHYYIYT